MEQSTRAHIHFSPDEPSSNGEAGPSSSFLPHSNHSSDREEEGEGEEEGDWEGVTLRSRATLRPPSNGSLNDINLNLEGSDGEDELDDTHVEALLHYHDKSRSLTIKRRKRSLQPTKRDSGYTKWKKERSKEWKKVKRITSESLENLQIWQGSFKSIEGRFGSPVLAYFRFLKWLFLLNTLLAVLVISVIILPQAGMKPSQFSDTIPKNSSFAQQSLNCTNRYAAQLKNRNASVASAFLDFVQGTGWMERTPLFYGYYYNRTYTNILSGDVVHYNMSVAYLLTIFAYFILSLFLMVHFTAKGVRSRITSSQDQLYLTCNKVFCGWDFSLNDPNAARFKHVQLGREYMRDLAVKRRKEELKNQSSAKRLCVLTIRVAINLLILAILVGAGYLIYYMATESIKWLGREDVETDALLKLLVEFSPSLVITVLNFIVPLIFQKLVLIEDYSPSFEIKITIFRSVTLRLASVAVLLVGVGGRILSCEDTSLQTCKSCEAVSLCWETYIGQQFYKLVLLDFVTVVLMTFFVQFPRKLIVRSLEKSQSKMYKVASYQEFEIPKEVLDIVYSQTLCWIGSFLSPIVLCMTVLKFFVFFYIKKLTLLYNCQPATRLYRASSSQTFFMSILLLAFVLCAIPVAFAIGKIPPSYSCGPFRVYSQEVYYMFTAMTDLIDTWPQWLQNVITFITSWTFYVPLIVLVCLITYYYVSLAAGKRAFIKVLLQQLSVATKDKQFLVHEALKRRQAFKTD